jgi:hypothetical protein
VGRNGCGKDGRKLPGRSEKTVLVDEFGDLGKGKGSLKRFGIVATVTRDPSGFGRIAEEKDNETKTKGELKYHRSDRR